MDYLLFGDNVAGVAESGSGGCGQPPLQGASGALEMGKGGQVGASVVLEAGKGASVVLGVDGGGDDALLRESISVLSYIGDAAFELFVRKRVAKRGIVHGDRLHLAAVKYVRAEAQAAAVKSIFDGLPEGERWLVKRARNRKITTKPRNADALNYRWATAFEALIGYYCLSGQDERLEEIALAAMELIDRD